MRSHPFERDVMRNLVLIHLESLNNITYRLNRQLFPTLRQIEEESISTNKYFSTATSTLMVIGDLLYGGMEQYEQCESLDYIPQEYFYDKSLFDELKEKGYETNVYIYPNGGDRESAEERHIAGFQNQMILEEDYEKYMGKIKTAITEDKPFALMLCNYISNLALNFCAPNARLVSGTDKWKKGFLQMDKCVADVWAILREKNVLNNTTVIFYGDHGDDFWQHSLHTGLTHAIEPYASLIHTPFFVYDNRFVHPQEIDTIISTVDIRTIATLLLDCDKEQIQWEQLDFKSRKYAYSRGSYAAQPVRGNSFNKAYSLTDGKYLILVSSKGLELYDMEIDSACQCNYLDFFELHEEVLTFGKEIQDKMGFHGTDFWNEKEIRTVRQKFYYLRMRLKNEVEKTYKLANKDNAFEEMKFDRIHRIHLYEEET